MRRRLLLSYLSLVLIVLAVLEVSLGLLADRHERSLLGGQAVEESAGLAIIASEDIQHGSGLVGLVDRYHQAGGSEVLIVYGSGRHAVDSDHDARSDRAELARPLAAAAAGATDTATITDEHHPFVVGIAPIHLEGQRDHADAAVSGEVALYLPAHAMLDRVRDIWLLLGAFGIVVALVTALVGARLASGLTRPLAALEREVGRLGRGDLGARAHAAGPPEVRALAEEFNGMADQIETLLRAQSDFVADASHQLRSPLAALRLRLENLESEVRGDTLASVEAAGEEVQRLSRLVDGLLVLTRTGGQPSERRPVDVTAVITERVESWTALAEERGVRLDAHVGRSGGALAEFVPGDLEQILDNFLANALEATPPGRGITVRLTSAGEGQEIAVIDEGAGMGEDDMKRAFDRFWQGSHTPTGSSGLGLAIVRQLAERNRAHVALRRSSGGTGVTAVLTIPSPAPTLTAR